MQDNKGEWILAFFGFILTDFWFSFFFVINKEFKNITWHTNFIRRWRLLELYDVGRWKFVSCIKVFLNWISFMLYVWFLYVVEIVKKAKFLDGLTDLTDLFCVKLYSFEFHRILAVSMFTPKLSSWWNKIKESRKTPQMRGKKY